ncbi:sel1 repeat family protein, partial [archaeon]
MPTLFLSLFSFLFVVAWKAQGFHYNVFIRKTSLVKSYLQNTVLQLATSSEILAQPSEVATLEATFGPKFYEDCCINLNRAILGHQEPLAWLARTAAASSAIHSPQSQRASTVAKGCLMYLYKTGVGGVVRDDDIADQLGAEVYPGLVHIYNKQELTDQENSLVSWLLGQCYLYGLGVKATTNLGYEFLYQAHDLAYNRFTLGSLGACAYHGLGCERNDTLAVKYFREAAEDFQYPVAMNSLGVCYKKGRGVGQSDLQAVRWYEKAAVRGFAEAMVNYGLCLKHG